MGGVFSNICRNAGLSAAQELNEALNKAVGGLDNHAQERIDQINGVLSARIDQMNGVCSARITQVGDAFADNATHLGERVEQAAARSVDLTERALRRTAREFATVTNQTLRTVDAVATNAVSSCRALERDITRDASHLITTAVSSCRALERDASHLIDFAMAQIRWTLWFGMVYVLIILYHVFVAPPLHFTVCSICVTALMNVRFSFQYRIIVESERQVVPCLPPLPRNIAQLKAEGPSCTLMSQDFKGSAWVGSSQTALILRSRSAQARSELRYVPTQGDIRTKQAYYLEQISD